MNNVLVGPLKSMQGPIEEREWTPPWWHGDEDASYSSMLAAKSLTRKRKR